jgi:hypothetical protein
MYRNKIIHKGIFPDSKNILEVLNAIYLNILDRIVAQKSYDFFQSAKIFEYNAKKPDNVLHEISINPFLGTFFNATNPQSTLKALKLNIKHLKTHTFDDAIATWPYKSLQYF